jgi:hypothetical protein
MRLIFAYLDPGSASIVFQAVVAGIIAVPVIFRNKITSFVRAVRGGTRSQAKETVVEPASSSTTDTPAS